MHFYSSFTFHKHALPGILFPIILLYLFAGIHFPDIFTACTFIIHFSQARFARDPFSPHFTLPFCRDPFSGYIHSMHFYLPFSIFHFSFFIRPYRMCIFLLVLTLAPFSTWGYHRNSHPTPGVKKRLHVHVPNSNSWSATLVH